MSAARTLAASRNTCRDMIAAFNIEDYMKVSTEFKDTYAALGAFEQKCQVCGNTGVTAWYLGCPCHPCCNMCKDDESLISGRGGKCSVRNCNELIIKPIRKLTALTKATEQVKVVQEKMIHAMQVEESKDRDEGAERRREAVQERPKRRRLADMDEEEAEEVRESRRAAKRVREEKKYKLENFDSVQADNDSLRATVADLETKLSDLTGGNRDKVFPTPVILFMDMHDSADDSEGVLVPISKVPEKVRLVLEEADDPWQIIMEQDDNSNFLDMAEAAHFKHKQRNPNTDGNESDDEEDEDDVVTEWADATWMFFDSGAHVHELRSAKANVNIVYKVKRYM